MQGNSTETLIETGFPKNPNSLWLGNEVSLSPSFRCSSNDTNGLLDHVYHTVDITHPDHHFKKRCILAPREGDVNQIDRITLERFPGDLYGFGTKFGGKCYPEDQLRDGTALKMGCPVTVLRTGCRGVVSKLHGQFLSIKMFSGKQVD